MGNQWFKTPPEIRFWVKVKKNENGCWEWQGNVNNQGYGQFDKGKYRLCHRWSYSQAYGDIPQGMNVLHKCDNPKCVRPDHLFLGTLKENTRDMHNKGRYGNPKVEGEQHPSSKLSSKQVLEIRCIGRNKRQVDIAKEFGVNQATVSGILRGKIWKHLIKV